MVNWRRHVWKALSGLRLKLVLLAACGIVPLTLLVADLLETQRQGELAKARQSVLALAREGGRRQAELLSDVHNLLSILTAIPAIRSQETAICGEILNDIVSHQPGLTSLWTASPDGSVHCSNNPVGLRLDMSGRQYFRDALKTGDFVVSNYLVGRLSGRPVLATALAFDAEHDGDVRVAFAGIDIEWLYHLAEDVARGNGIALVLVDGEGTLLAHTPPLPESLGKSVADHPLVRAMLATTEGAVEVPDLQGVPRIFAHVALTGTGARLAVGVDRAAVLERADRQRMFSLAMLLLVAAGSMVGAALAGEVLVLRWLNVVREAASKFGRGDLSVRAPLPPGGELRELAGAFNDMADSLEQRELSMSESEARFRDMAEVSSDWFWETGADHRFTYMSQGIRMIGIEPSYFVGMRREELASVTRNEVELEALAEHIRTLRSHRPFRNFTYRMVAPDGTNHHLSSSGKPVFDKSGAFVGYRGVGRDMTDAVEAALAMARAREEAEAANRAKSRFLAVMSHELRTPMTGVLGTMDLLQATRLSAEQSRWLDIMRTSAQTLMAVLNDILDFSKIEADQLKFENIDFQVKQIVLEVIRLFERTALNKGVVLTSETGGLGDTVVCGDPTRLRQVLLNLVGNAVKFTERGCISIKVTAPAPEAGKLTVRFEVQDSGIGIGEAEHAHLFQAFSQADATTTRRFGGTGLGLAICRRLVEGMGGAIGLTSKPGLGSTFWFTVPLGLATIRQPAALASAMVLPAAVPRRILLAEDNDLNRLLVATMLKRMGHSVVAVEDGLAAVEAVGVAEFDVGILDIQMPVMGGTEAAARIREIGEAGAGCFPLIALTATASSELQVQHELQVGDSASGFDRWMTKPIDWRELGDAIEQVIHQTEKASSIAAP
jgi:PAS domain S-box-containing protein